VQLIDKMRLNTKLLMLLALFGIGLLLSGVIGYLNISSMKKNLDTLYFGSLTPVVELNTIIQDYHDGLESTVFEVKSGLITPLEGVEKMRTSLLNIERNWDSYLNRYKREEEIGYVQFAHTEIKRLERYFMRIIDICLAGCQTNEVSTATLIRNIDSIHSTITRLINYEVDVAKYERQKLLETYQKTLWQLSVIIIVITASVLIIAWAIFISIKKQQLDLLKSSQKLKQLNQRLEDASYTDPLTGLHNRRYFNIVYENELLRAKRTQTPLTFMMIDVDYFKQYNDTYGHIEGDKALQSVAKVLQETMKRPTDFIFRLGGEEFGVLITTSDETNAKLMSQKICQNIEAMRLEHSQSEAGDSLTVSIGTVVCTPAVTLNGEGILSRADENLYQAKSKGRNGYIFSSC